MPVAGELGFGDLRISGALKSAFTAYEASLYLKGKNGFGPVFAHNLDAYLVKKYFGPSATQFPLKLPEDKRQAYIQEDPRLKWDGKTAHFSYLDFAAEQITRMTLTPGFDSLNLALSLENMGRDVNAAFTGMLGTARISIRRDSSPG